MKILLVLIASGSLYTTPLKAVETKVVKTPKGTVILLSKYKKRFI